MPTAATRNSVSSGLPSRRLNGARRASKAPWSCKAWVTKPVLPSSATNEKGRRRAAAPKYVRTGSGSIVHAAHAAAAGHRHRGFLLRPLGDHRFGGDEETGD